MPGYIIHLTEAKLIFDMLKQNSDKGWNVFGDGDLEQWFREFSYGALLPDSSTRRGKAQSHFWGTEPRPCIVMTPQIARFLQEYDVSFEVLGCIYEVLCGVSGWKWRAGRGYTKGAGCFS